MLSVAQIWDRVGECKPFIDEKDGVVTAKVSADGDADHVGASRPTAYLKLADLADEGTVEQQKIGGSIL